MQRGLVGADAAVAADQVQLADRHIKGGFVSVFKVQKLLQQGLTLVVQTLAHVHVDKTSVTANAVGTVNHRVAHIQFTQVFDERLDVAHLFLLATAAHRGAGSEQLGFGHQVDAFFQPCKASVQAAGGQTKGLGAACKFSQIVKHHGADAARTDEIQQTFAPTIGLGQHQHALLAALLAHAEFGQGVVGGTVHGQVGQGGSPCNRLDRGGGSHRQGRMVLDGGKKLFGAQEQMGRWQHRPLGVALGQSEALLGILAKALQHGFQLAVQHHQGCFAQVIKHGGGVLEKQREVVLDTRRGNAIAHVFVNAAAGRVAVQKFTPTAAKQGAGCVVHWELAARQQAHFGHGVEAALGVGVEGADRVDFLIEQIHPVGHQGAHREQINQTAAHGVFARTHHL